MRLPVHRWFRYSAGFSAEWAERTIAAQALGPLTVLDPFAGSGTTLLAAGALDVPSFGIEAHPFVARVARAKLWCRSDPDVYLAQVERVLHVARGIRGESDAYPALIRGCFADEALAVLDGLRRAWLDCADDSPASELVWLTLVGTLRPASHAGTAPWQYVLPGRRKREVRPPLEVFARVARIIVDDMRAVRTRGITPPTLLLGDARSCTGLPDGVANLVLTSPPYPNNYDYADATRLEMSFFGEIAGWGDLQHAVRRHLIRSCSHQMQARAGTITELLVALELVPIREEIARVCATLATARLEHRGRKAYHLMVAAYFLDMAHVWQALRRVCASPAVGCFVVGDSAPYGVHVPVIDWLGALALAAGFRSWRFERTRDRNVKWRNRKHRVPLCEGRLWVEG